MKSLNTNTALAGAAFSSASMRAKSAALIAGLVLFSAGLSGSPAAATPVNIVQNPGFETGDMSDWTVLRSWQTYTAVTGPNGVGPYDGTYYAGAIPSDRYFGLYQFLTTSAGESYDLSFAFISGQGLGATNPGDVIVQWGGIQVADITPSNFGWNVYTIDNLVATTGATELFFEAEESDPAGLDDVSVVSASATPLPSTWTMLIAGFVGLGYFAYRGTKKNSAGIAAA